MKTTWLLLLGLVASPAFAVESARTQIDPAAEEKLRQMSNYLAGLKTFRVESKAVDEKVTTDGQKLQFLSDSKVTVQRPNKLRDERLGAATDTIIRYDGKELSIYGKRTGFYATSPAPATLDATIDFARARYGFDAPGGDLLVSRPYDDLMEDVRSGRDLGIETVDGVPCHHLAFRGTNVDWQIWIEDGPRPLPHRYVISTKDQSARPEFTVSLTRWEPNVPVDASAFDFTPPPGAQRIKWIPLHPERANR